MWPIGGIFFDEIERQTAHRGYFFLMCELCAHNTQAICVCMMCWCAHHFFLEEEIWLFDGRPKEKEKERTKEKESIYATYIGVYVLL